MAFPSQQHSFIEDDPLSPVNVLTAGAVPARNGTLAATQIFETTPLLSFRLLMPMAWQNAAF
jgi:hypothetical protein